MYFLSRLSHVSVKIHAGHVVCYSCALTYWPHSHVRIHVLMPVKYSSTAYVCRGQCENAHVIINPSHNPPLHGGRCRKQRDNYCRASNAGDPCSCASPLPDSLYYCCYLLLSARLCDHCTIYVAELITPPLDSASDCPSLCSR